MTVFISPLQQFAEQVLYGRSLADKLRPPSDDVYDAIGRDLVATHFIVPAQPTRPRGLTLQDKSAQDKSGTGFPTKNSLDQDRARGMVLHFFANHELLALEIMALALLRFRDAPAGFLRGIVQTMADEQRHMTLYLKRMQQLGVEFGESVLNAFFWKSLKDMQSPQEYAAAMSLTFEQANLDFSLHFEQEFFRLGDIETAEILAQVRRDEIGHVKHGAIWLERWRSPAQSLWQEYQQHLRFPLTPARAKGILFDREGRLSAGIPKDFVDELEVYSASRGRPPRVFWFNPACEQEVAARGLGFSLPKFMRDLSNDLAPLMMHVSHSDDVVLVHERPTTEWIATQKQVGFDIPEFVEGLEDPARALRDRKLGGLNPWGWSPTATHELQPLVRQLVRGTTMPPLEIWNDAKVETNIFSKIFALCLRTSNDLSGQVCRSMLEIRAAISEIMLLAIVQQTDHPCVVIKSPIGSSGRNAILVRGLKEFDHKQQVWCERILVQHGAVLIEPWVERIVDLSCQIEIAPNGKVRMLGFTRFIVNRRGQYKGHIFGKLFEGLSSDLASTWYDPDHGWEKRFTESAMRCGQALFKKGYHGPAGIDGFIYRDQSDYHLQALGEINPRYTMGRIAWEISKQLVPKHPGVWLHLSKNEILAAGFPSIPTFAAYAAEVAPPVIRSLATEHRLLESGVLCTNDPSQAKQVLSVLVAESSLKEAEQLLKINLSGDS